MIYYTFSSSKSYLEWGFSIIETDKDIKNNKTLYNVRCLYDCVCMILNGKLSYKYKEGGMIAVYGDEFVSKSQLMSKFIDLSHGKYDNIEQNFIYCTFNNMEVSIDSYIDAQKFLEVLNEKDL